MARYCGSDNPEKIFSATQYWIDRCLLGRKSVFTEKDIWSQRNLDNLIEHYVENLDTGKGKFFQKLHIQLENASDEAKVLVSEMLWVMFLCPTNITTRTKKKSIRRVWEFSNVTYDENHHLLDDAFLYGVGDCGIGYNNHRWRELKYFVCIISDFHKLKLAQRKQLLNNGQAFSRWLESYSNEHGNRQLRHMLLFMIFPDDHDRIFSTTHRERVIKQLTTNKLVVSKLAAMDIDHELLLIRSYYEAKYKSEKTKFEGLDFYAPPLCQEWSPNSKSKRKVKPITLNSDDLTCDLKEIMSNSDLTGAERLSRVKTRIGQGAFRANLITYWGGKCSVTRYQNHEVLIASHIKAWRDSTPHEKVSIYNGLLLTPNLDKAFDKGLISFTDTGRIVISNRLSSPKEFGIDTSMTISIEEEHKAFLAHHRKKYNFD